jgi:hypothetical protein
MRREGGRRGREEGRWKVVKEGKEMGREGRLGSESNGM